MQARALRSGPPFCTLTNWMISPQANVAWLMLGDTTCMTYEGALKRYTLMHRTRPLQSSHVHVAMDARSRP